jgi:chemotaxis protein methyltransferase WspC
MELLDKARQLADQGNLEKALRLCEKCLKQNAVNIQCHFLMGLLYQASGDQKKAEECLNRVIYLDPNHQEALSHMAVIARHQGDQAKAVLLQKRIERLQRKIKMKMKI